MQAIIVNKVPSPPLCAGRPSKEQRGRRRRVPNRGPPFSPLSLLGPLEESHAWLWGDPLPLCEPSLHGAVLYIYFIKHMN